ncbi:GCG_CRPN prefix-to-repeats domain-containing protein [Methylovirgula sp. 4M-Z18]|uniref:GCG_CRPN prefix-to-repeats domain-containing protein n=1 Tax=Methylovirgula sp. 4M-Z18 TaxID=2293567 RepID=UPI000E2FDFA6|nr:hypothetical protein [Methylovirgula sp. 4M-Z18]RFB80898.1 hypothetical protein DYH55_05330 [Methylovirgula sp. 4M-Z18]
MKAVYKFAAVAILAGSGLAAAVSASSAMPVATDHTVAGQAMIEKTAGGCGPGWHPNPWGHCVPFHRGPEVVVRPGWREPPPHGRDHDWHDHDRHHHHHHWQDEQ